MKKKGWGNCLHQQTAGSSFSFVEIQTYDPEYGVFALFLELSGNFKILNPIK